MFTYATVAIPNMGENPSRELEVVALPLPPVEHNPFGLLAFEPGRYRRARQRRSISRRSAGGNRCGDAASTGCGEVSGKTPGVCLQIDKA